VNVVFRTDGSSKMGTGHVMRCITLAKELAKKSSVTFVLSYESKYISELIKSSLSSCKVVLLPESKHKYIHEHLFNYEHIIEDSGNTKKVIDEVGNVDWLIIDHYGIDEKWETKFRSSVKNIMVIDDLANRKHDCDILLDQNFYIDAEKRYDGLVPDDAVCLIGVSYALLREEFVKSKKSSVKDNVDNILVSFGGGDPDNITAEVLEVLKDDSYSKINVNAVMSNASEHKDFIKKICEENDNFKYHLQIDYMARLMSEADIFIGAGGSTSLERMAMGLPSVVVSIAENQNKICEDLAKANLVKYVGTSKEYTNDKFKDVLNQAISDKSWREFLSLKGVDLVDGTGVQRVKKYITKEDDVLFLGSSDSPLISFLEKTSNVIQVSEKITKDFILKESPDFLVSFGYKHILKKDILDLFKRNNAINLHISLLPYNRGADPNFWSFVDDTPKGVTIHLIDEGVDTGDIIVQKEVFFGSDETLKTTYHKLQIEIISLFKKNWPKIKENKIKLLKQNDNGTKNYLKDKEKFIHLLNKGWDTPVVNLKGAKCKKK
jgi:UDP-2,4-diacetamido-2,4,6-trideoxy-beta-L-altropyranose hydrolase